MTILPTTASLPERLRTMPSSLNGACRTMDEAADRIEYLEATEANQIATLTARVEELEAWQRARLETGDLDRTRIWELEAVLRPFAADKMPSARRSEIAFDRHGLRRCISPLELARDKAFAVLQPKGAAV